MQNYVVSVAIGYLLGSVPFGYLLVRFFRGADVRTTGSGNIGATNVARTSPALGFITLVLDFFKGFAAVWLAASTFPANRDAAFAAALAAICGHVFPLWLRFRGGKGVATGLGSFLLLTPKAILLAIAVFMALVLAFRYISLGSIAAAAALPVLATVLAEARSLLQAGLVSASSLLIIVKHHHNIQRLFSGAEPKFGSKHR